jgi:hypothetical protein
MNEQAFRNLVTVLVIGTIFAVLAGAYLFLLSGSESPVGAVCAVGFLLVAFLAWEYLLKPGYGLKAFLATRDEPGTEQAAEPATPEEPRSPRAP